jgi:hypothetical protein
MIVYLIYLLNLIIIFFFDFFYFYIYDITWFSILVCSFIKNNIYSSIDFFVMLLGLKITVESIKKTKKYNIIEAGDIFLISSLSAWHGIKLMPKFFIINGIIISIFIKYFKFSKEKVPMGPSCCLSSLFLTCYNEFNNSLVI